MMKYFDERDNMFSRFGLVKGTAKYKRYYQDHPHLREDDDRARTNVGQTLARIFDIPHRRLQERQKLLTLIFAGVNFFLRCTGEKTPLIPDRLLAIGVPMDRDERRRLRSMTLPAARMANMMQRKADGKRTAGNKITVSPEEITAAVKQLALSYGGDIVGVTKLQGHHHYSHRGDMFGWGGRYGEKILPRYQYAIVVAAALDLEMIKRAPGKETQVACILGYARTISVTSQLVLYIKSLGYDACTDNAVEYMSPMTPLAAYAGIGQIGRCNMVVSPRYGNRLKIGAVLTNLPLLADAPVDFGLVDFCRACRRCAQMCPARAISFGEPEMVNGLYQWPHDGRKCMEKWMTAGTGICMACCPFSLGGGAPPVLDGNPD